MEKELVLQSITKPVKMLFTGEGIELPPAAQEAIERHWESLLQAGRKVTRGDLFTIGEIVEDELGVEVRVASTDYAHYLATTARIAECLDYPCRVMYTAVLIQTIDDVYVIGEMGPYTSTPGRFTCVGGGITRNDLLPDGVINVRKNAGTELSEETGLDCSNPEHVRELRFTHLRTGGARDFIGAVYLAETAIDAKQVEEIFQRHNELLRQSGEEPELTRLVYLPNERGVLKDFLTQYEDRLEDSLLALLKQKCG